MEIRLAEMHDLVGIKSMYQKIVEHMNQNNISIWDEVYPCEFFQNDIKHNNLYLLSACSEIVAAFVISESNAAESHMKWKEPTSKASYIDRFGVNVDYLNQGIGVTMLQHAAKIAKERDSKYLRLFVVDINRPAIKLYTKNGFEQVEGIYEEKVDNRVLREYGFEIELR